MKARCASLRRADGSAVAVAVVGEIEEVVVVGTRRSGRSTDDLPVPVDVLGERELGTHGYGDMLDALTAVAPSHNVGRANPSAMRQP